MTTTQEPDTSQSKRPLSQQSRVGSASFRSLRQVLAADAYRYTGRLGFRSFVYCWREVPGFHYTFWLRLCVFARRRLYLCFGPLQFFKWRMRRCMYRYGIAIPYATKIGPGFAIHHFGGIVINEHAILGGNCNISQGVTIGKANRGKRAGCPTIGDNVYIGPGAKIFGHIMIGNNVAVGANCVVTRDVPDNAVVAGVPGRVISYDGTAGYVNRTNYPDVDE